MLVGEDGAAGGQVDGNHGASSVPEPAQGGGDDRARPDPCHLRHLTTKALIAAAAGFRVGDVSTRPQPPGDRFAPWPGAPACSMTRSKHSEVASTS